MSFSIVRQDITKMHVDAIVNAANTELLMGGGVCGAIFSAAGADQMQEACDRVAPIHTGEAAVTLAFRLPAKYVIHASGPVYDGRHSEECERLLRSAYTESLKLAEQKKCASIAFPLISSGIYGYPKDQALQVAVSAIRDYLAEHEMDVYLAVYDRRSFQLSQDLLGNVESYIDAHYIDEHMPGAVSQKLLDQIQFKSSRTEAAPEASETFLSNASSEESGSLEEWINDLDEPFNVTLMRLIDAKGYTDAEVYKKANIDRRLFSKIRSCRGYQPGKRTILALCIALELDLQQTEDLLETAGYALSHSRKFDVIVEYFIVNHDYDIYRINEVLFHYDQPLLGGN